MAIKFFEKPNGKVWVYDSKQHSNNVLEISKLRGDIEIDDPRKPKVVEKIVKKSSKKGSK